MSIPINSASTLPLASPPPAATPANTYSDVNGLAALKKDPSSPQALHAVAQQIDALFLQMMLKSMRDASSEVGAADSNEMSLYQDLFDKQISLSLSEHGGLGLGAQLTRQLAATAADSAGPLSGLASGAALGGSVGLPRSAPAVEADARAGADAGVSAAQADEFVDAVYPSIQRAAQAVGVSPVAMLAQAVLETGWGRRMARGADGAPSHNLFGIKADDRWTGGRVAADTLEFSNGVAVQRRAAFRAYGSVDDSVDDFARLLANSPRYRDALTAGSDAQAYVRGLGSAGYATDPQYAQKLSGIMGSAAFRGAVARRPDTSGT